MNKMKNKKEFFCNKALLLTFIFRLHGYKHKQGRQNIVLCLASFSVDTAFTPQSTQGQTEQQS
jgi:hypothetical protein